MNQKKSRLQTVDEYIRSAPKQAQATLRELRELLKEVVPYAEEGIKWGSPVFIEKRILFAYTAHKSHVNFMPTHSSLEPFKKELSEYKTGKDTIQFHYGKPLPEDLIKKIAMYRVKDVRENDALWMG
ncbi:DUF1801 domain-containing protein [Candidatus Roizmanbacteria bacterium]|nr:DUF1801 domain-containing protein [Candidatus Roizmanbacteria bacterium]